MEILWQKNMNLKSAAALHSRVLVKMFVDTCFTVFLDVIKVATGGALQADVLSLASNLPPAFQLDAKLDTSAVLFDYKYLRNIASTDEKVTSSKQQSALDRKAKEVRDQIY